jgi:hypothetical protein
MPPEINQTAQKSVHGNHIPSIGRVYTPYLLAGTPDTGCALRGATLRVINPCHLHDPNGMSLPDDITKTLSKHGGSLCYMHRHVPTREVNQH